LITTAGIQVFRNDPRARAVSREAGSIVVRATPPKVSFAPPALSDLVIYQLHVGTLNGPTGGGGTFGGIHSKLDYLRQLGVNAIQLLPVAETSSEPSAGYDPSFPFAARQSYGGPSGLRALVEAAHARGIALLIDVVFTHLGPENGVWQLDATSGGGAYFAPDWRSDSPWGKRLDYSRAEVRQYIRDNAIMWLEEYGADGLHWSGTSWIRGSGRGPDLPDGWMLMQSVNRELLTRFPGALLTAEDEGRGDLMTRDVVSGGAAFGAQWDLGFASSIRSAVIFPRDGSRDMDAVTSAVNGASSHIPVGKRVIYTESHDDAARSREGGRLPARIFPGQPENWYACQRASLAAALTLTSPGTPLLFQGQERLASAPFDVRVPLDWRDTPITTASYQLYQDLLHLRWNWPCLRSPNVNVFHINRSNKVIAFHRWTAESGDNAVVVVNFKNWRFQHYVIGLPFGGTWRVAFKLDRCRFDPDAESKPHPDIQARPEPTHGMPFAGDLSLGAYELVILTCNSQVAGGALR
jgi:1,4-alpha-glucan branching enzyme